MQDRFKFRAWNKENEEMVSEIESAHLFNEYWKNVYSCSGFSNFLHNDNYEVMQCTGLKDKNGKLIYEGDIIKYDNNESMSYWVAGEKAVIRFRPARFLACMRPYDGKYTGSYNSMNEEIEDCCKIIGNIHENPELLKGQQDDN